MNPLRPATLSDVPALELLISFSARSLQASFYQTAQTEGALGTIFAVDRQLIEDGTYFITESDQKITGCGGWSFRKTLCGGENATGLRENSRLQPGVDAARIRAFFVHPAWARKGIATQILEACETALMKAGFNKIEILSTLAGEPFYARYGYRIDARSSLDLPNGEKLPVVRMLKELS